MRERWVDLLQSVLSQETGAGIIVALIHPSPSSRRSSLTARFEDYEVGAGPEFILKPHGMTEWLIELKMGHWSRECLDMMRCAKDEQYIIARQILITLSELQHTSVVVAGQSLNNWTIPQFGFNIQIKTRTPEDLLTSRDDSPLEHTARNFMAPLIAAAAELIGYESENLILGSEEDNFDTEGRLLQSVVKRRERSPRNRMLCIAIHGNRCAVCKRVPDDLYAGINGLIEVHHIEPVSRLVNPRPYDPKVDLIPLCPTCHRATHKADPPMLPSDLKSRLKTK